MSVTNTNDQTPVTSNGIEYGTIGDLRAFMKEYVEDLDPIHIHYYAKKLGCMTRYKQNHEKFRKQSDRK